MIKIILSVLFFTNTALADAVIFSGNDVKTLKQNIDLFGVAKILSGSLNPSSGGGVAAPQGSIYMSTTVGLYEKTGAGNTAWTKYALLPVNLATQVTGTLPVTNGGTGTATAFTQGSVVFAGASGVYTQDNANYFWDDANNRLGIGTATPQLPLHVLSTAPAANPVPYRGGMIIEAEGTNSAIISSTSYSDTTAAGFIGQRSRGTLASPTTIDTNDVITSYLGRVYRTTGAWNTVAGMIAQADQTHTSTALGSSLSFNTTSNNSTLIQERMRITNNGNIGVGLTAPTARIHQDSGTATATAHKFTAGTTTGQLATDGFDLGISTTGQAELRQRENLDMAFFTNNTQRMTIDSSGQVGIGFAPPSLFYVHGTGGRNFSYASNGRSVFQANDNGSPPPITLRNTIEAVNNGTALFFNLGYGGTSGAAGTSAEGARILATAENIYTATSSTQDASLRFFTATDGLATEKVRITSSGQVSIGNTAATTSAKLDIQGTDGALLFPRLTTAQKNALTPTAGMQVYDTTLGRFECYTTAWSGCGSFTRQVTTAQRNALPDYFGQTVWNTDNSKLEVQQNTGRWAPVITFGSSAQTSLTNNDSIVLNVFDMNQTVRVGATAGGGVGISTDATAPFLYSGTKPDGLTVTLVGTSDTLAVTVLGSDTANGILAPDITLGYGQTATYRWEATLDRWILIGSSN